METSTIALARGIVVESAGGARITVRTRVIDSNLNKKNDKYKTK